MKYLIRSRTSDKVPNWYTSSTWENFLVDCRDNNTQPVESLKEYDAEFRQEGDEDFILFTTESGHTAFLLRWST